MARTLQLSQSVQVILDANGNGTVQLGPTASGETWSVTQMACYTSSVENNPVFNVYLGDPTPPNFQGGTFSGNNDANTGISYSLAVGQFFSGQWVAGDPGAEATFTVFGTRTVG